MNGLSDSLTIGLVLALVFGALFFYLYSRIGQVEKRVSLTENILLDLKIATENTFMAMSSRGGHSEEEEEDHIHIEPTSAPEPMKQEDVENIPDEAYYKSILQNAQAQASANLASSEESTGLGSDDTTSVSGKSPRMDVNYESMTLKELKALAKQRGINVTALTHKKDFIDALKRQGQTSVLEPVPGSQGVVSGGLEEGFPVELGSGGSA